MSILEATAPASNTRECFREFARKRLRVVALSRGQDPDEAEALYRSEWAERKRMASIRAEEVALQSLRPRASREDRYFGQVYDKHYRETVEAMPVQPERATRHQDVIGDVARRAIWKFWDLDIGDLRQEIELEALLLERDTRPQTVRDADGTWASPGYITTCLKNRVRDYVRAEFTRRNTEVPLTEIYEEPVEDFHADIEPDVEVFTRETLREGLVQVVLNPNDLPAQLRGRLSSIRESLTPAEHRAVLHYSVLRYLKDHGLDSQASVSPSTQRTMHRVVSKYLEIINE
ncbi:hypothetical protein RN2511_035880 [Rhodococcus sp. NKCM2511]|uniref:hypothetical protein n=1 Tax=Rhodococcus sp. NKCM2511 TaxID=2766011 RepID=UPI0019105A98|nr:hypothetical protein [Rhodococcus sp. NKCM2511]GHP18852.1 hypothetical protein RN2511_035880 [Rhodococcus sp. NKCM2511]